MMMPEPEDRPVDRAGAIGGVRGAGRGGGSGVFCAGRVGRVGRRWPCLASLFQKPARTTRGASQHYCAAA